MDKLFNRVAKSFFLLRPMCNLLTKKNYDLTASCQRNIWIKLIYSWWKQWLYMLNTVIISAFYPLLLKIKNEKYYKRSIIKRKEVLQLQEHSSNRSILGGERYLGEFIRWIAFQQRRKISFFFLFQRDQFAVFWFRRNMTSQLPVREIFG